MSFSYTTHALSLFIAMVMLFPTSLWAARVSIETVPISVGVGDQFLARIILHTEGEKLNAFEGTLEYPDTIKLSEIRTNNSAVSLWLEEPQDVDSAVRFAGVVPGGVLEGPHELFSIVFTAQEMGTLQFALQDAQAFRNDGEGSRVSLTLSPESFSIRSQGEGSRVQSLALDDAGSPEPFDISLGAQQELFEGGKFIAFLTQDKGSGILRYEVCEGIFAECVIAESPYLLERQSADVLIRVKAIDEAENVRTAFLLTPHATVRYAVFLALGILSGVALFMLFSRTRRLQQSL